MEDVATRDFRAMTAALLAQPVCVTPPVEVVAARARMLQRRRAAMAVAACLPVVGVLVVAVW